jgi:hypothetical protein
MQGLQVRRDSEGRSGRATDQSARGEPLMPSLVGGSGCRSMANLPDLCPNHILPIIHHVCVSPTHSLHYSSLAGARGKNSRLFITLPNGLQD